MKIFFWGGGGHHKIGLVLGVISMHFRVLSLAQGTELGFFLIVAKISNVLGVFDSPDICLG